MKKITYSFPKSSFLSMEKDTGLIVNMMLKNENLKKMLHHTTKDCLSLASLTEDESLELFGKNIKIVPKISVDNTVLNYVIISFDNFTPNETNPEFRDNLIEFDILCHYDQWQMKDFALRPFRIAAEIDTMFNDKRLTGIGTLEFVAGTQIKPPGGEYGGLCLLYRAVHGEEDKKNAPNPNDEQRLIENFNQIFNT